MAKKRGGYKKGSRAPFSVIKKKFEHYKELFSKRLGLSKSKGGPGKK